MDNHIPKPVSTQYLIKTLCKWLARAKVCRMAAGKEQKLRFLLSFVDAKTLTSSADPSSIRGGRRDSRCDWHLADGDFLRGFEVFLYPIGLSPLHLVNTKTHQGGLEGVVVG